MASVRGTHVLFTNIRGTNQVWRLSADLNSGKVTGVPERITEDLVEAQFPDVRPDDSLLTSISRKSGGQGVFLMDLKTRRERRVYQSEIDSAYSTFSPDGTQIAFGRGGPAWSAFTIPTAGGDVRPAGNAGGRIRGWTRDGRYLLVWRVQTPKPTSIGILDLSTSQAKETMRAEKDLGQPRLSPDNRWVAFQVEAGPRSHIWLAPFRGASPVPESEWIAIGPGAAPFWSLDSGSLYFARYPEGTYAASLVMRQKLDPASGHPAGPATEFYRFETSLDNQRINTPTASRSYLYTLQRTGLSEIWMMELPSASGALDSRK
jgi:Tol biopolymer transport system component